MRNSFFVAGRDDSKAATLIRLPIDNPVAGFCLPSEADFRRRLAKGPGVGHIRRNCDGDVAEWLKAAVC
jgi:hypothetical protein